MSSLKFPPANISREYAYELFEALNRDVLYDPDDALFEDPDVYEKFLKDSEIVSKVQYRTRLTAGTSWRLEPVTDSKEDRAAAVIMTTLVKQIKGFSDSLKNLSKSFIKGITWAKIKGIQKTLSIPGYGRQRWWVINRLKDKDKRNFDLKREDIPLPDGTGVKVKWHWRVATRLGKGGPIWDRINTRQYVRHIHSDEERGLGHGVGISAPLYLLSWYKQEVLKNGLQFLDRWSQGLIVWTIDQLARAEVNNTPRARAENAKNVIDSLRNGSNIVKGKDDTVEVFDPPDGGWDTAEQALTYFDNQICKLILGAVLPSGNGQTPGSFARAQVEDSSTQALIEFDRGRLGETVTEFVVKALWDFNRPLFVSLGLGNANMPEFVIDPGKQHEPKERVEVITKAVETLPGLKGRISLSTVSEQLAIPLVPSDHGEETLADLERDDGVQGKDAPPDPSSEPKGGDDGDLQDLAMNGAQISSAVDIIRSVSSGELPPESAVVMLTTFFLNIDRASAEAMVRPAVPKEPVTPPVPDSSSSTAA